jgi:hypothetical protein
MARRQVKSLDALDSLNLEAEKQLERLELAEALGLLAWKDRQQYLREVDPETALYESPPDDETVWH